MIRDVYARAGLDPAETELIEAHGTGTQAGDPIETGAISRVFGANRRPDSPVRVGSIKTNVGHLEGASGIAGVVKAVLMLENRMMLPSRNFVTPNPRIQFDEWNLKVCIDLAFLILLLLTSLGANEPGTMGDGWTAPGLCQQLWVRRE